MKDEVEMKDLKALAAAYSDEVCIINTEQPISLFSLILLHPSRKIFRFVWNFLAVDSNNMIIVHDELVSLNSFIYLLEKFNLDGFSFRLKNTLCVQFFFSNDKLNSLTERVYTFENTQCLLFMVQHTVVTSPVV